MVNGNKGKAGAVKGTESIPQSIKDQTALAVEVAMRKVGLTLAGVARLARLTQARVSELTKCEHPNQMNPEGLRDLVADQMRIARAVGGEWGALFAHAEDPQRAGASK